MIAVRIRRLRWHVSRPARRLIESSTLSPEPLHVAFQAFDAAWAEISNHFDGEERHATCADKVGALGAHRNERGRR
jgi:hypothetical protein